MFWVEKFCWIIRVVKYSGCLSGSELGLRAVASLPSCNLPLAVLVWGSLSFSLPPGKANFAFPMTLSRNGCAGRGGVPGGVTATAGVDPKGWTVSRELCRAAVRGQPRCLAPSPVLSQAGVRLGSQHLWLGHFLSQRLFFFI